MNKKGNKYLSIWDVVIWFMLAGVLLIGMYVVNSAELDVRKDEAKILYSSLADCLSEEISINLINESFDLINECNLHEEILILEGNLNAKISVKRADGEIIFDKSIGKKDLYVACASEEEGGDLPRCYKGERYANNDDEIYKIEIITASSNFGERRR